MSRTDEITVLMTGAGAPGASGIIKSLRMVSERSIRIVGVDMESDAYGFAFTDTGYTVPAGIDDAYISRMREIASEESVDVILPLTTAELEPLTTAQELFDAEVMVSKPKSLKIANNKGRLYQYLEEETFDTAPEYRRVSTKDKFVDAVHALGYPDTPVCFKPPVASGMRGFRVLDETTDRLDRLLSDKPDSAVTTLEEVLPILTSTDSFPDLAVMEYLPGKEYSVDVLAMGDKVGPVIPRTRERTRAGITFEGKVEKRDELIDAATSICKGLDLEYNINLQFRYDSNGHPRLIEINPRIAGTVIMCVGAGANLPYLAVQYALGEEISPSPVNWGTRMVRYWEELFHMPDGEVTHFTNKLRE